MLRNKLEVEYRQLERKKMEVVIQDIIVAEAVGEM